MFRNCLKNHVRQASAAVPRRRRVLQFALDHALPRLAVIVTALGSTHSDTASDTDKVLGLPRVRATITVTARLV